MKRRIKKAVVKFLSLCPKGANQLPTIYKADETGQRPFEAQLLMKGQMTDNGELTALVYIPEFRDSDGDIASASVIKEAMYESAKEGLHVDIRHDCKPLEKSAAYIAESFIVQKNDPRFEGLTDYKGNPVDPTDGWGVVIKIDDPDLRTKYKNGEWQGISLGGYADLVIEKEAAEGNATEIAQAVVKALKTNMTLNNLWISGDIEMTPEELKAIIGQTTDAVKGSLSVTLKEQVTAALTEAGVIKKAPETPATPVVPAKKEEAVLKFEGDPTPENLAAFRKQVVTKKITDGIDWTSPESIEKAEAELRKLDKPADDDPTEAEAGIAKEDTDEVKVLKMQLAKAERRSNQDLTFSNPTNPVNKEVDEQVKIGQLMAKEMNEKRGYK